MPSEQMPNDDELRHIYDIAYRDDIPVWHSEVQAIRAVYEAGVAAERERAARIAESMAGSEPINSSEYSDWADWRAGRRVAAAIREGE